MAAFFPSFHVLQWQGLYQNPTMSSIFFEQNERDARLRASADDLLHLNAPGSWSICDRLLPAQSRLARPHPGSARKAFTRYFCF